MNIEELLDVSWVHIWEGFVKSRLVVRGDQQYVTELQDDFAITPIITALRVFLWQPDLRKVNIEFQNVSTAILTDHYVYYVSYS